jgi:type II secretion system protein G
MKKNKKNNKGFTLIELMVVISIIGLLSSIVLASLKGARDKAKSVAFRESVMSFTKALELYRSDNGRYPGQPNSFFFLQLQPGIAPFYREGTDSNNKYTTFKAEMDKYIKQFPTPTLPDSYFYYYSDPNVRCSGDSKASPYNILISPEVPGFTDWPYYTYFDEDEESWIMDQSYRCFSLK